MKIPITQSKLWLKLQDDLGEKSFFKEGKDNQYLAILKSTPVGNYLYLPYGPVAKNIASFRHVMDDLMKLAIDNQAVFIRIEPFNPEYVKILPQTAIKTKDLNPKESWQLDISGDETTLLEKLPSRLLRYYRGAEKKGISIEISRNPDDIKYLIDLQKSLAAEKGISTFSERYLKTELKQPFATLYLVKYNPTGDNSQPNGEEHSENVIAAGMVFDDDDTRYNLQGAQSDLGRKLHATGILTIQLILDAKAKNLKVFDFWGIAPEGAPDTHPWAGFTNFKKTFKGYEVDHAGTYDIVQNSLKYHLYCLLRKINLFFKRQT